MAFFDEVNDFLEGNKDNILMVIAVAEFMIPFLMRLVNAFGLTKEDIDFESGRILETGWQKLAAKGITREKVLELLEQEKQKLQNPE